MVNHITYAIRRRGQQWQQVVVSTLLTLLFSIGVASANDTLLIDDFQSGTGQASFGTNWSGFTDRVMGGLSDLSLGYQRLEDDKLSLRLQGQVRLENNGGFIQARLSLEREGERFDASQWQGVRVKTRGIPGPYYIHLRSRATWLPWQYYTAPLAVTNETEGEMHEISFSSFTGESTRRRLDVSDLKSIAIVAFGEAVDADIEVMHLEFYR